MRFANFELESPFESIVLVGLGHCWDLHNFAEFRGSTSSPDHTVKSLEWRVQSDVNNPWGSPGNTAVGCRLVFSGVRAFRVQPGLAQKAADADIVAGISKVIPGELEYPFRLEWDPSQPYDLRVEFEDEGQIDIDAELATLEAIPRLDV